MSLQAFFDSCSDGCEPLSPVTFAWSATGVGFGQLYFYVDPEDNKVHCANETMGREFIKRTLCAMVDNCVLDEPGGWPEDVPKEKR